MHDVRVLTAAFRRREGRFGGNHHKSSFGMSMGGNSQDVAVSRRAGFQRGKENR